MKLSEQEFTDLRGLIQGLCGICLGDDKRYLIQSRLEPLLHRNKLGSYAELVVRTTGTIGIRMQDEVVEAITTKETSFNRDGHPFDEFRRSMLPLLIQTRMNRQRVAGLPFGKLRIWSAATSTGQEAYSLAIAILELIRTQPKTAADRFLVGPENFNILGTDISSESLRIAVEGQYYARELERGIDGDSKRTYFMEQNGSYAVNPLLKTLVDFQRINLVQPIKNLTCFDMVLCRNLLIYFDEPTRRAVLDQLIKQLSPGGILMLGAAESTACLPVGMNEMQFGKTIAYRKINP